VLVAQLSDEPFEFRLFTQTFEMRIDQEERPAGESSIDAALEPAHCFVGVSQYGMYARDLIAGVVSMAEGTGAIQGPAHTLQCQLGLLPPGV
jgi:hypothetical protein